MRREHIRATFEKINEAHHQWKTEQGKMRAEADRVLTRLLNECLAKRMSPEHIAEMAGWPVRDVRSAMRARGIDPKAGKGVLSKQSASALIDNANLLGVEPEEMDLTSPLAYLPMGSQLREFLETEDTPHPERVTLSAEEREAIVAVNHCQPDGAIMRDLAPVVEGILAAREQALRAATQPVQSILVEGLWCTSCESFEYDEPKPSGLCSTCGCAGSAHIDGVKIIAEGQVEA